MTQNLVGKSALVTGGSRGIGAAIVRRFAQEGADVAFTYLTARDRAEELAGSITAAGGRAVAIQADSADSAAVRAAVDQAAKTFGRLDILVNNAGLGLVAPVEEFSLESLDAMLAVNVRGVFVAVQAAVAHLGPGGRVINIGSINADRAPFPGISAYVMTKAAVAGLTRGLARELAARGITVNTVQVGPTATDSMMSAGAQFTEQLKALMLVDHFAKPDDIASTVAYLASPEAHFVTGASWNVDGGYMI